MLAVRTAAPSVELRAADSGRGELPSKQQALVYKESVPHLPPLPRTWHRAWHWTFGAQDHSACQLPPACLPPSLINSAAATLFPFAKVRSPLLGMRQPL